MNWINGSNVKSADEYINYIENAIKKKEELPAKVYRYESSSNKTENDYNITISLSSKDITLTIDKESDVLIDNNKVIVSYPDNTTSEYLLHKNGYRVIEYDSNKNITTLQNIEFTSSDETRYTELNNISYNSGLLHKIPSLSLLANDFYYQYNYSEKQNECKVLKHNEFNYSLKYDAYGIPLGSDKDVILYQKSDKEALRHRAGRGGSRSSRRC